MSDLVKISRRSLFIGAASIIASPAIIRFAQLMPIKPHYLRFITDDELLGMGYKISGYSIIGPYPTSEYVREWLADRTAEVYLGTVNARIV